MAKRKEEDQEKKGIFKYLKPEEIDAAMIARINDHRNVKGEKNKEWQEDELMMRRQVIIDYMAQGLSRRRIVEHLCDRWGICMRVAYVYYSDAIRLLAKDSEEFMEFNREKMVERLEYIMTEALDTGNYREAVMACQELDKILGLQSETKKLEIKELQTTFKFGE